MLTLTQLLADELIAHCRSRYPKEACGYLAGRQPGTIEQVYPMRNVEDSPIGYSMDPKEQLQVDKLMRQRGQRLLGIYHSHTASPAYPSSVDVGLAISPDVSYVLLSLVDQAHPDLKSYRIDGQEITSEPIRIAAGSHDAAR
jgi:proteasome lid subunit RPN8/RPN11